MKTHRRYSRDDTGAQPHQEPALPAEPTQYAPPPSYDNNSTPPYVSTYPAYPQQLPQTGPSKKKVIIPQWLLILLIISSIGFGYMVGYASASANQNKSISNNSNQNFTSTNNSQDNSTPTDVPTVIPTPAGPTKIGNTIDVNGVDCTLVSVSVVPGDEFTQPKAGNEFIVVHIKLVNNSGSDTNYNEFDFHARSSSGNVTDPQAAPSTYTANTELNSGTLSSGGRVEGDIILEVPKGDHGAELSWEPGYNSSSTDNLWNLGL